MTIEKTETTLTVTFTRRWNEKLVAALALLIALETPYLAWRINLSPQQTVLSCDRGRDACLLSGHDVFGGSWTFAFPASRMQRSRIAPYSSGEQKWVVDMKGHPTVDFGNRTSQTARQQQYAANAAALQAFIADPARSRFEARFSSIGGPSSAVWAAVELLFGFVLFRFVHGWRARIVLDRTASKATVERRPSLWPPGRRQFPLADIERAVGRSDWMVLRGVYMPLYRFCLIGPAGRVLFKRTAIAGRKVVADFDADIQSINNFLRLGLRRQVLTEWR